MHEIETTREGRKPPPCARVCTRAASKAGIPASPTALTWLLEPPGRDLLRLTTLFIHCAQKASPNKHTDNMNKTKSPQLEDCFSLEDKSVFILLLEPLKIFRLLKQV